MYGQYARRIRIFCKVIRRAVQTGPRTGGMDHISDLLKPGEYFRWQRPGFDGAHVLVDFLDRPPRCALALRGEQIDTEFVTRMNAGKARTIETSGNQHVREDQRAIASESPSFLITVSGYGICGKDTMSISSHTMTGMQCYFDSRLEVLSKRSEYDGGLAYER